MGTCNRRTFLKRSAMLTATVAAARLGLPSLPGKAVSNPRAARLVNTSFSQVSPHPFFTNAKNPEVIAHRGGDGEWPGETMYAMRQARDLGVDVLEMDVYRTKDGKLVLMHDIVVSKTTNVSGLIKRFYPVHKFTLSELQELNAGYRWPSDESISSDFRGKKLEDIPKKYRKDDVRVPSLEEVFKEFPNMRMNIEMKPAFYSPVDTLSDMIRDFKMTEKVLVASLSHRFLRRFRRLSPEVATSASPQEVISYIFFKQPIRKAQAIQLTPEIEIKIKERSVVDWRLTPELVKRAHDDNLHVHAWTIDDAEDMKRVKELGVNGIITDYPSRLLSVLGRTVPA